METELFVTVWLASMLLNFEAYLLNKSKASLIAGIIFVLGENIFLLYVGVNGLYVVLPISMLSFFACLKVAAKNSNVVVTGKANAAQVE